MSAELVLYKDSLRIQLSILSLCRWGRFAEETLSVSRVRLRI